MLMQIAAGFLAAAADPPSAALAPVVDPPSAALAPVVDPPSAAFAPVVEWCSRGSYWTETQVIVGGSSWTMEAGLSYVPTTSRLLVSGSLTNLGAGYQVSLYLPLPYPCVSVDPAPSIAIVNWVDPTLGWLHASILKPPGIPWPEAMEAGAVVLLIN